MKKYFGKKMYPDTIYFMEVLPREEEDKEEPEYFVKPFLGSTVMNDRNAFYEGDNDFEDMNDFITYSEIFNIYQMGKV